MAIGGDIPGPLKMILKMELRGNYERRGSNESQPAYNMGILLSFILQFPSQTYFGKYEKKRISG
jgi:hypothetical protein